MCNEFSTHPRWVSRRLDLASIWAQHTSDSSQWWSFPDSTNLCHIWIIVSVRAGTQLVMVVIRQGPHYHVSNITHLISDIKYLSYLSLSESFRIINNSAFIKIRMNENIWSISVISHIHLPLVFSLANLGHWHHTLFISMIS